MKFKILRVPSAVERLRLHAEVAKMGRHYLIVLQHIFKEPTGEVLDLHNKAQEWNVDEKICEEVLTILAERGYIEILKEIEAPPERIEAEMEVESLSAVEKQIYNVYGPFGVSVYRLCDGEHTVDQIAEELNASKDKVLEMINKLHEMGFIYLDEKEEQIREYKPLIEDVEKSGPFTTFRVYVPRKELSLIEQNIHKFQISFRHGKYGRIIFENLMRGEVDEIEKALKYGIPISKTREIIGELKLVGLVRDIEKPLFEVGKRYGGDSKIIFRRYGPRGVVFYLLSLGHPLKKHLVRIVGYHPDVLWKIYDYVTDNLGLMLALSKEELQVYIEKYKKEGGDLSDLVVSDTKK